MEPAKEVWPAESTRQNFLPGLGLRLRETIPGVLASCPLWDGPAPEDAIQEPQEMRVRCLGQEDPLEEEMATHSSIPAWKIPWMEENGGLQSMRLQRVSDTTEVT